MSKANAKVMSDVGGVRQLVERCGAHAPLPLKFVASRSCIEFKDTAAAMIALAKAVQAYPKTPSQGLLGNFRKQHPQYAFMWTNKTLASCKPFIDLHGSSTTGSFSWDGDVPVNNALPQILRWVPNAPPAPSPSAASSNAIVYVNSLSHGKQVFELLSASTVLFIDLEGDLEPNGRISLLQVSGSHDPQTVYLIDTLTCPSILRDSQVKRVLSAALVVLHDARRDTAALRGQFQIVLSSIFDTQVAHQVLEGNHTLMAGLNLVLSLYANVTNTMKTQVVHREGLWEQRPLPPLLIEYAAQDVVHLPAAYRAMKARMTDAMYTACLDRSKARATTGAASSAAIRRTLVQVSTYLLQAGGYIHLSTSSALYAKFPELHVLKGRGTLSDFFHTYGPLVTPSIVIVNDKLMLQTMDTAAAMTHLAAFLRLNGGKVAAASLTDFYKAYPGVQTVLKPSKNSSPVAFIKRHGAKGTPPIVVQGASTLVLKSASPTPSPRRPIDGGGEPISPAQLIKTYGRRFAQDKWGVAVTHDATFANVLTVHVPAIQTFVLTNQSTEVVSLRRCFRVATPSSSSSSAKSPFRLTNVGPMTLAPFGGSISVACRFLSNIPGRFHGVVAFEFESATRTLFVIGRVFEGVDCVDAAMDAETRQLIQQGTSRRQKKRHPTQLHFAPPAYSHTPSRNGDMAVGFAVPLGRHALPASWSTSAMDTDDLTLTMSNHTRRFQDLLYREEQELLRQQREYDMEHATLHRKTPVLFELAVPGLAEGRPSLVAGDKVLIRHSSSSSSPTFQGTITQVRLDGIYIAMPAAFSRSSAGPLFNVRFVSSRTSTRLEHQGLHAVSADMHTAMLFPSTEQLMVGRQGYRKPSSPTSSSLAPSHTTDLCFSRPINPEQALAIRDIHALVLSSRRRRATSSEEGDGVLLPYLLFGPPGTGKTVTIVEAIIQLLQSPLTKKSSSSMHILVCAPSNAAADNVVARLATQVSADNTMRRVMAFSRRVQDTPASVLPFTTITCDGESTSFVQPSLDELNTTSVLVTTIATGAKLFNWGVQRGFFDLIVFDEAAQATEPAVVAVVGPLATRDTVVVLAGDPKQLGPVVKSTYGVRFGLGKSLMERLLPVYEEAAAAVGHHPPPTTTKHSSPWSTKLVRNYRSHPDILAVPNAQFYDGDLVPSAPTSVTHSLLTWPHLPNPSVPLVFHGVAGGEVQTNDSPSWFNPHELQIVLEYVEKLLAYQVLPADIGVITPYAKQRQKLQETFRRRGVPSGVLVGSVEQFQGGERRVIVISTVRSAAGYFEDDSKFQLGFVAHPKRFNVAVTRAQAMLIVVGNPAVLETSPDWKAFLGYCMARRVCRGVLPTCHDEEKDEWEHVGSDDDDEFVHEHDLLDQAVALQHDMERTAEAQRREREAQYTAWRADKEARHAAERKRVEQMEIQDYARLAMALEAAEEIYRRQDIQRQAELHRADQEFRRQQRQDNHNNAECIIL
ncbi:hypothetical protein DYB25_003123 [Aphanomyces astaci]|uniref:RNA helicase n=1 Tax=Aphanomyces astaci TaxID=112090 RepID=A0A397ADI8_APHAT|nr:hypothetical protein DYB25_003123 [Aphanomyces astaci]